ncbi:ankyrin repeat-containing domain protein [Chytriomyces sp. MP71]|nr:ankyrin repeat-containing domain protein [Chytriomyces sp. MP71]
MVAKRSVDGSDSNSVSSAGRSSTGGPTHPVVSDFRPGLDAVPEDTDVVAAVFAQERKAKERELEGFRADTRRMLPGNAADLLEENQLNLFRDGNLWQAVWEGNIANVEKYAMQEYLGPDYLEAGQTVVAPGEKRLRGAHERGGEGETILHIAVLLKHKRLAEWIVTTFRSLVNETYLKHKYFGETALHIAVVNSAPEDISLVEFLVEKEAHINGPLVTGTEFLKDEDKGSIYYGQTILQFAASVKKEKIVRYLVEKGALLHDIDIYGNNVLHVMAYHGDINVELFHWLRARNQVEIKKELAEMKKHNPDLSLSFMKEYTNRRDITKARNKDNLTPFQVGVARGHVQIIDACKEILWEVGPLLVLVVGFCR